MQIACLPPEYFGASLLSKSEVVLKVQLNWDAYRSNSTSYIVGAFLSFCRAPFLTSSLLLKAC